jgi:acetate kinase
VRGAVVLSVNPGSRSLKAAAHDGSGDRLWAHQVPRPTTDPDSGVTEIAGRLASAGLTVSAVAHRVVHGGPVHVAPERIDDELVADLRELVDFAPLHLPGDLDSIEAARSRWPDVPHVACFDTAFHATLGPAAHRLPVPDAVTAMGVRRYGFHGLSVQHVVDTVPGLGRAAVAHLGGGCSVTAVARGRSVQTSMSFSPTGGLPSVSRSGDLDPQVLLFLVDRGWTSAELRGLVDRSSGLAGMSGGLTDVAELTDRAAGWLWRCSPPQSPRPWPDTPRCSADWTRSSSPAGSVSTPPRSATRSPTGCVTSASRSTRPRRCPGTSAAPVPRCAPWS